MEGWTEDPNLRKAFDWLLGFVGSDAWKERRTAAEAYRRSLVDIASTPVHLTGDKVRSADDQLAWYLYLAETYLSNPEDYDHAQGSRVIPVLIAIGRNLEYLQRVAGVDERVSRMVRNVTVNPDAGVFELLVATAYARDGWSVSFLQEAPPEKTPDLAVKRKYSRRRMIECKRLAMVSNYSIEERKKWLNMWHPVSEFLTRLLSPFLLDIVFHVELRSLDDSFLERELMPKLQFVVPPGVIIDNDEWTVKVRMIDLESVREKLKGTKPKVNSSSFNAVLLGHAVPNTKGFTCVLLADLSNNYVESISFAAGALWSSDAEAAIRVKARDIRDQLAKATNQLPHTEEAIVHIGLETLDGWSVEEERYRRITNTVGWFDNLGKRLSWIYVHLFGPSVPPDKNWLFDETVFPFQRSKRLVPPLKRPYLVIPADAPTRSGVHWDGGTY